MGFLTSITDNFKAAFPREESAAEVLASGLRDAGDNFKAAPAPFPGGSSWNYGWARQANTNINYSCEIGELTGSSLIMAAVNWAGTTFPEAPLQVLKRKSAKVFEPVLGHPLAQLFRRPNLYVSTRLMWMAMWCSRIVDGNSYFLKYRNAFNQVIQLWYEPHFTIRPRYPGDPYGTPWKAEREDLILYYEVLRNGHWWRVEAADVIHFRYGLDPHNPRMGLSPVASVLREIFTDNERARFSALILKNGGVIPYLITPDSGTAKVEINAQEIKDEVMYRTTGDNVGKPMVLSGPFKVQALGVTPDKLLVDKASKIPEERVAAVIGIPAAVLGFGVGLEQTKVGAPQPVRARLWTPTGSLTMGEVARGHVVATPTGWEMVQEVYPQGERDIYRITFQDGSAAESTLDHLWTVKSPNDKDFVTLPLSAIAQFPWWKLKRTILPLQGVTEFDEQEVLIPPYLFGLLLADGSFRRNIFFSNTADEIVARAMRDIPAGYGVTNIQRGDYLISYLDAARGRGVGNGTGAFNPMKDELRRLGLWMLYSHEKFIPDLYKYNSSHVRRELLRGLLDGDGFVNLHGQPALEQTSQRLAEDVTWLVQSLGGYTLQTRKPVDRRLRLIAGRPMRSNYDRYYLSIVIENGADLFTYTAKKDRCRPRAKAATRKFRSIELVRREEARCIKVEGSHYLTDNFLVTHNTMRELREQAYECFITPHQGLIADDLALQLQPDFSDDDSLTLGWDLSLVRVLQEDRDRLFMRETMAYEKGVKTRAEARSALGLDTKPEDDVYFVLPQQAGVGEGETDKMEDEQGVGDGMNNAPPPQLRNGKDREREKEMVN